jgi:DNA-binding CsgD family transcriptional regulator
MLEDAGLHELAATVAREGLTAAREHGLARTYGAVLACNLAEPLVSLGRWEEAAEVIERALQLFPPRLNRSSLWRLSGDMVLARGDLPAAADAVTSIRAALRGVRYKDEYQLPVARLEAELRVAEQQPAAALAVVEETLDQFNVRPSPRYAWPLLVAGVRACTAATAAGQSLAAQAGALLKRLCTEAGKLAADGPAQQAHQLTFAAEVIRAGRAPGGTGLAGTGLAGGPPADTCAAWDAAAQAWESVGQRYPLALAQLRAAEAALSAGDRDGGGIRLRQAEALARGLGAQPLSDEIARLARRARIPLTDAAGHGRLPGPQQLGLTARELEVLRLVAAGHSNRDIANELFISVKTASVHVSNILGKLGVASRGEAAATAHRLQLFES